MLFRIVFLFIYTVVVAWCSPESNNNNDFLKMLEDRNDVGKAILQKTGPKVLLPSLPPHAPSLDRRWGRHRWRQQQGRLNSHALDSAKHKRVNHIRNSINHNRHDRGLNKIPRHPH